MADKQNHFFSQYFEGIKTQLEERVLLYRLKAVKIVSNLLTNILVYTLIVLFGFFVFLFFSIMLAFYLSKVTGNYYWGFGMVGGIYLILLVVCILFRKKLFGTLIMGSIANIIFDKTEKKDKENEK